MAIYNNCLTKVAMINTVFPNTFPQTQDWLIDKSFTYRQLWERNFSSYVLFLCYLKFYWEEMFVTNFFLSTSCASCQFFCTFNMESKKPKVGWFDKNHWFDDYVLYITRKMVYLSNKS